MKRQGVIKYHRCFSPHTSIIFDEGDKISLTSWPEGYKNNDRVEVTLINVKGSATYNLEKI